MRWRQVASSRNLTINHPQRLPHCHNWAGPGTSLRSCGESRTTAPAVPEFIATKYTHAKSKKIVVQVPKKKHNETVVVNSKSKGLLHGCPSESKD